MKDETRPQPAATPLPTGTTPLHPILTAYPAFAAGLKAAEESALSRTMLHGDIARDATTTEDKAAALQYLAGLGYGYISGAASVYALLTLLDPEYAAAFHEYCDSATSEFAAMAASARAEVKRREGEAGHGN